MKLTAKNVVVSFRKEQQKTLFGRERQVVLNGVSLELKKGESLALVGESGSGKSTLGRVLCGLLKPEQGSVCLDGIPLYGRHSPEEKNNLRHKISIVFQNYTASVNPRVRVRDILWESLRTVEGMQKDKAQQEMICLLEQVGLGEAYLNRYPHELSGGQLQRVCIARAVALNPAFIVLDEAISSLDASTQTQVMDLLMDLKAQYGFSYLFITHDLTAVTYMCDRVLFFYKGNIVEQVNRIEELPFITNPYAKELLASVIHLDPSILG